jgi:glutathione/glutaredoxin type arsenate reductase
MKKIMFVCKKNSRRSQMAEGFAKTIGKDRVEVVSAGLEASFIDPKTIEVMKEVGIDISNQSSKPLSDFKAEDFDVVISLCGCGVNLPPEWVTREIFEDWQLDDPEGEGLETYRRIRSEVKERVEDLIGRLS